MVIGKNIGMFLCVFILLGSSVGCNISIDTPESSKNKETKAARQHDMMSAVLWQQKAGEALALQYQAYNMAKEKLSSFKKGKKKPAVILDIDETVLDNSPYQAYSIQKNKSYPTGWDEWIKEANAKSIAGAKDFLDYANQKQVDIYYVSNRDKKFQDATLTNLRKEKLPQVNKAHLLLPKESPSKQERRDTIAKGHSIVLLIGDNLEDFSDAYDSAPLKKRNLQVQKDKDKFGDTFIVLPNAMYGGWEGAIFDYNYDLSETKKEQVKRDALNPFK